MWMEILRMAAAVRRELGIAPSEGMVQPWARAAAGKKGIPIEMRYVFEAVASPDREIYLAVERL
jgi:hypothetical protein